MVVFGKRFPLSENWGKCVGVLFGYPIGGGWGCLSGLLVGHLFDKVVAIRFGRRRAAFKHRNISQEYFSTSFILMGYLASEQALSRHNSQAIVTVALEYMGLSLERNMASASELYSTGTRDGLRWKEVVRKFHSDPATTDAMTRLLLETQLYIAFRYGRYTREKRNKLLKICDELEYPRLDFDRLEAAAHLDWQGDTELSYIAEISWDQLNKAYASLGLEITAEEDEVKRVYRRLLSQHHPDKLLAQGKSPEFIRDASEKTRQIKGAYELIREVRGF